MVFGLFNYKFSICIDGAILLNELNFVHYVSIIVRIRLFLVIMLGVGVDIFGKMLIVRVGSMIIKFFVHVYAIEIHIFDGLLFRPCRFTFTFAFEPIMVIVLI